MFDEYMFSTYYFSPLSKTHMSEIMKLTMIEMRITDQNTEEANLDDKYLDVVFNDFFNMIYNQLSQYTVSIKEYAYMCLFLYPHYMEKVYAINKQITQLELQKKQRGYAQDELEITRLQSELETLIEQRGIRLSTKEYRGLLQEMLKNLY